MGLPGRLRGFGRCCAALLAWLLGLVALPAIGPALPSTDDQVVAPVPAANDELPAQRLVVLIAHRPQGPPAVLEAAAASSFSQLPAGALRARGLVVVCEIAYVYDGTRVQIRGYVGTSDPVNRWDPTGLFWRFFINSDNELDSEWIDGAVDDWTRREDRPSEEMQGLIERTLKSVGPDATFDYRIRSGIDVSNFGGDDSQLVEVLEAFLRQRPLIPGQSQEQTLISTLRQGVNIDIITDPLGNPVNRAVVRDERFGRDGEHVIPRGIFITGGHIDASDLAIQFRGALDDALNRQEAITDILFKAPGDAITLRGHRVGNLDALADYLEGLPGRIPRIVLSGHAPGSGLTTFNFATGDTLSYELLRDLTQFRNGALVVSDRRAVELRRIQSVLTSIFNNADQVDFLSCNTGTGPTGLCFLTSFRDLGLLGPNNGVGALDNFGMFDSDSDFWRTDPFSQGFNVDDVADWIRVTPTQTALPTEPRDIFNGARVPNPVQATPDGSDPLPPTLYFPD